MFIKPPLLATVSETEGFSCMIAHRWDQDFYLDVNKRLEKVKNAGMRIRPEIEMKKKIYLYFR